MASPIATVVILTLLLIKARYFRPLVGHLVALAPLLSVARDPGNHVEPQIDVQNLGWPFE